MEDEEEQNVGAMQGEQFAIGNASEEEEEEEEEIDERELER